MGKKLMLGVVLAIVVFLKVEFSEATEVSGNQSGTWSLVGSPYVIIGTVTVPSGAILVIEPKVKVMFATNTSLVNYGTLLAIGTSDGTITFTSNAGTPTAGDWNSIKFSGSQSKGTISYCVIEYGKQAVYLENTSKITITYNTIGNNEGYTLVGDVGGGIYLKGATNNIIIGNTIFNNQGSQGQTAGPGNSGGEGGTGVGIYLNEAISNTIRDNIIYNNQGGQGGTGGEQGGGGRGGIGVGIYLSSSTNNTIADNTLSSSRGGQGGAGRRNGNPGNGYGVYIDSNSYNNTIDSSNTYNGEPTHYYYGITTLTTIEYQTLTLAGSGSTNLGRIILINCSNFTIRNNFIAGGSGENGHTGGYGYSGSKGMIGAGVYLSESTDVIITNNIICNHQGGKGGVGGFSGSGGQGGIGVGVYLGSATNNTITNNAIYNNQGGNGSEGYMGGSSGGIGTGVYLDSSPNNIIVENNLYNNQGGTGWIGGCGGLGVGIYVSSSVNNTISKNTIFSNKGGTDKNSDIGGIGCGIYFSSSLDNLITENTISQNIGGQGGTTKDGGIGCGIYFSSSSDNLITENTISQNMGGQGGPDYQWGYYIPAGNGGFGVGIYLSSSTNNNTISGNTISNNTGGQGGKSDYGYSDGSGGTGVSIYLASSDNNIIKDSNTIIDNIGGTGNPNGNGVGIYCKSSLISELIYNNIYNNQTYNLQTDISPGTQTAEYNWWGADPPATYTFSGNIDYEPWLTKSVAKATIVPSSGTVGTFITVSGEDFGSTELIRIDFGTTRTITTITTNTSGTFTTVFTINTQSYGTTTIVATGLSSSKTALNSFCILPNILFVSPCEGTVGSIVTIRGNGFGANELVCINFGTTPTIQLTSTYAEGSFTTAFTINTQSYGTTTIRVVGLHTQAEAMDRFFIAPNIILVTPTLGTVGSFVTIRGHGFGANEPVCINFGTTPTIQLASTYAQGSFTTAFTINTQPYGLTTIVASGLISRSLACASFSIVPKITAFPTAGQVGSFVTVSGNGFGATELIRVAFGTTATITFASTYATGEFQAVFTVNSQPIGTTTIIAYGLMSGGSAITNFYILPFTILKITPATQNIAVNSTFTAQVEIKDVERLRGAELHLSFNPNILEVIEIGTGTFPPDGWVMQSKYDNIKGEIDYTVGLISGSATGSGVICKIKFRARSGGTSTVIFDFVGPNRITKLLDIGNNEIPFNKEEAIYQIITGIEIKPKDKEIRVDGSVDYTCLASCGSLELDVTGSTTFTANGGGSFTLNTFFAKYMGTYTIQGEYLGFIGTTSVIILPGTPTTLVYVSGNNQVNTCTFTLKDPFIVKVMDKYSNPCPDVEVNWEIIEVPIGATGYSISPTKTTTNVQGTASSFLTLGTEPPGTYTVRAISTGLNGSPCTFTTHSLRRFGNIAGFCMLDLGTTTLGTCSDIQVRIVEIGTTTMTNGNSYFIFKNVPVGTYTLTFDTWGASPATKTNVCIGPTQFKDTTDIGTINLLAGDITNDGKVNIEDWPGFIDAFGDYEGNPEGNWAKNKEGDFNHDKVVNICDFGIFADNFGKVQQIGKATKLAAMPAKAKKTSGSIELSFNLETLEGVDINELRVGNIIYLKIYIRDAKDYLGGEIHLSFNPKVLQIVGSQIEPGDFPQGSLKYSRAKLKNKVDNLLGKIDYAVVVWKPEPTDGGLLATVPFKVISCGAYSKVGFEFDSEENRETMFIERTGSEQQPVDQLPEVSADEITINVPMVFNNLDSALVYPNPAYKGQEITFDKLTTDKQVTLRIYNLAGELVIEKEKAKGSSVPIKWNLRNKDNEDVASGIYIYFLNDNSGSTKRGKIGIIK